MAYKRLNKHARTKRMLRPDSPQMMGLLTNFALRLIGMYLPDAGESRLATFVPIVPPFGCYSRQSGTAFPSSAGVLVQSQKEGQQ